MRIFRKSVINQGSLLLFHEERVSTYQIEQSVQVLACGSAMIVNYRNLWCNIKIFFEVKSLVVFFLCRGAEWEPEKGKEKLIFL